MKNSKLLIALLSVLLCGACTTEGEVSSEDLNKIIICKDTRDGEVFKYNTNTVHDIRVKNFNELDSISFTTVDGKKMTITGKNEVLYKCHQDT